MMFNLLGAAEVFRTIGSVLLAILILLVMITVHEFGHYLAGKLFHFTIDEFSIGFGPALFKRRSKKTGELFSVRLIPLGGYCAFGGEDGLEEEETPQKDDGAGMSEAASDAPEKEGEHVRKDDPNAFTKKPCWQRIIVLIAGAAMNYLLALLLILVNALSFGQMMTAVYEVEPSEEYAAEYSLRDRDILLGAEGKDVYLITDLAKALNGKNEGDMARLRVSRVVGEEADGTPVREEKDITVILRADVRVGSTADTATLWQALGVRYDEASSSYMLANAFYKFGFFPSVGRAFVYSFRISGSIFQVIGELFTGKLGLESFGGPVTTIAMTSQLASMGLRYFLEIAGYIGVNLAVFNLLPIPALDGSKVIFTAIEWVRGKPIKRSVEGMIHFVGIILLLGFAILVDILQFI